MIVRKKKFLWTKGEGREYQKKKQRHKFGEGRKGAGGIKVKRGHGRRGGKTVVREEGNLVWERRERFSKGQCREKGKLVEVGVRMTCKAWREDMREERWKQQRIIWTTTTTSSS